jgi:N-acetylmuramoyl-L-alanine amidase
VKTQASTTLTRITLARGGRAFRLGAGLLLVLLPLVPASARVHHNDAWARQQFTRAERMREALNGRPRAQRTRHEYQRVIDSYRQVYLGSPASSKADPSVVASAELMVEMGRRFDDNKILHGAIDRYYFLRNQYPGSKYRFDALFTIGEIYKDDLNSSEDARRTFEDFLHRYPRNRLADDARAAVQEIDAQADARKHSTGKLARKQRASGGNANRNVGGDTGGNTANNSGNSVGTSAVSKSGTVSTGSVSASNVAGGNPGDSANSNFGGSADSADASSAGRSGLPRITGVRHWSTPDYTRVAIDVEQEVKFASQRISNPDRIFFDLRDTRLASTLVGKTFDVDDGFLKKIRVAEFQPGRTRIVLEVDDLASYDAFLLPDPYRLIIDIHGKGTHGNDIAGRQMRTPTAAASGSESEDDSGATAVSSAPSMPKIPANVVPNAPMSNGARKTQQPSGLIETDLAPPDDDSANSPSPDSARPVKGIGVIKTTTAVKGSDRRIPKTIVEAEDRAPTTMAKLEPEKIRPEATADSGDVPSDEAKPTKSSTSSGTSSGTSRSSSSASSSASSAHHKKSRSSVEATDTSDRHLSKRRGDKQNLDAQDLDGQGLETRTLETREARPTASGDRSLTRALGLKIGKIVIDAGHGGHDTGTIGPNGLAEKDVVLDVAKRLGRLLETRLGAEVVYTRQDDTFIPLETRTAIANRERADLFISIHANSSRDSDARGVETYYLNFTSSPEALEVAARENAVSEKSIHELQDLVKKIAMKEKIDESREFAGDVQESLYGGLALQNAGIRDRGIKKAPFIVLIGANMPSILAEISFVSNPTDERKLETAEHRQRIAESLYRGVSKYVNGLSGVKVASKIDKGEGQ